MKLQHPPKRRLLVKMDRPCNLTRPMNTVSESTEVDFVSQRWNSFR